MEPLKPLEAGDPREVGPYRLVARLGAGGMGRVFLGRSRGGRAVAVKVVRPELAEGAEFRERFAREVAAARRVNGVFTAGVVDADPEAHPPWLATAYVPGVSLDVAVARSGAWPEAPLMSLAAGLAEALEVIHAAGVVHRDLKPSNVLLAADGPRVIDFGISVASELSAITRTGAVIGTPGFMSPEQLTGAHTGAECDVFALGAVLAFAASGTGPFGSGSAQGLMFRIVYAEPELDSVPTGLRPLVTRCLAKDPRDRPTVAEVLAAVAGSAEAARTTMVFTDAAWLPQPVALTVREYARTVAMTTASGEPHGGAVRPDVPPPGGGAPVPPAAPPTPPPALPATPPPAWAPYPASFPAPVPGAPPGSPPGRRWLALAASSVAVVAVGVIAWQAGAIPGSGRSSSGAASGGIAAHTSAPVSPSAAPSESQSYDPSPAASPEASPAVSPTASAASPSQAGTEDGGAEAVAGSWLGTYVCNQGITGLSLTIEDDGGGVVSAVFSFFPDPSNPLVPRGSFAMSGTFLDGELALRGAYWIEQPPGFLMVDLAAEYDPGTPGHLDGVVYGANCLSFSVARS
ncbi:serine/threonine-protein kinase [Streptomyces sp. NPDC019396]|uniref:serine/threonine-protein kinase n=1 Tax=Streptomyces sp. NPDC019396 TaxID=3154687 RepID=UPI0033E183F2